MPQGWHKLGDKRLRYVYQLLAEGFGSYEIKNGFHYLGFSLKSDTPITTVDIADLPGGRQHTTPYFASIKELQRPHTPTKE